MYRKSVLKKGKVKKHKKGRSCKKYGCKQPLSIYNAAEYCHVHLREFPDN